MPKTLDMWSAADQKVMPFTLARRDDDGDGNEEIILERVDDNGRQIEAYRFSPGYTDEELDKYVKAVNRRHSHQLNDEEVE